VDAGVPHSVCIFEDKKFSNFFPLSLSQPVFDLRIGAGTLRSRMQDEFSDVSQSVLCRDYLAPVTRIKTPDVGVNEEPTTETLFVNGRLLCLGQELPGILEQLPDDGIAIKGGYVIAARLGADAAKDFSDYIRGRISEEVITQLCDALRGLGAGRYEVGKKKKSNINSENAGEGGREDAHAVGQDSLEEKIPVQLEELIARHKLETVEMPGSRLLSFPWQLIGFNADAIADDFNRLPFRGQSDESVVYPAVQMIGEENIVIGDGATIKSGVVLDASEGPIIIADRSTVMPNASIVGPVAIGVDNVVKTGAKILEGTSTGNVCKIGGEIEGTIFGAYSNKQHDGFMGHSYLGEWVNIGAASNNSDLKNNYSPIRMWNAGRSKETGRQFLGLIMGDHTKTGINTMFNTGTVVGFNCNIFSSEMPGKFVPSYSWGHGTEMIEYDVTRAMQTAEVVLERREVKFSDAHRMIFEKIHELSNACQRNV
jgi:UDP-N-acetylglucosamine diphosphorylase/glucosamine-1-phosphate N-acetyltransferase